MFIVEITALRTAMHGGMRRGDPRRVSARVSANMSWTKPALIRRCKTASGGLSEIATHRGRARKASGTCRAVPRSRTSEPAFQSRNNPSVSSSWSAPVRIALSKLSGDVRGPVKPVIRASRVVGTKINRPQRTGALRGTLHPRANPLEHRPLRLLVPVQARYSGSAPKSPGRASRGRRTGEREPAWSLVRARITLLCETSWNRVAQSGHSPVIAPTTKHKRSRLRSGSHGHPPCQRAR